ncbi:MAG: hypothetical protein QOJ03_3134 [Frankiaceae bacterium]|nr:hypothetical protein [Frankiaceae bacterium]
MTVLPGDTDTGGAAHEAPKPARRPSPRSALLVGVVVAAVALASFGGWKLLDSGDSAPAAPPTQHRPVAQAPQLVPLAARGQVTNAKARSVAAPVFTTMSTALGGWTANGNVHVKRDHIGDGLQGAQRRCFNGPRTSEVAVTSGSYTSRPFTASGEVDIFASNGAAAAAFRSMTRGSAIACLGNTMRVGAAGAVGSHLSRSRLSTLNVHGLKHAFGLRLVVGYVSNGHEVPMQLDTLATVVGRTHIALTVISIEQSLGKAAETRVLQAMVKQVEQTLR